MTDVLRPPLTIQAIAEANRTLLSCRFPEVPVQPGDRQAVVFPSQQLGKTYLSGVVAALEDPRITRLRPRPRGPAPGDDYLEWYRRNVGEPFDGEPFTMIKPASVGMTEVAMVNTLGSLQTFDQLRALDRWRLRGGFGADVMTPNGQPVANWEEKWSDGDLTGISVIGIDYASDHVEWDVVGWGKEPWKSLSLDLSVKLKAPPAMPKRDLLCSSANVDLNKAKTIRSTKPLNQVIRSLVVTNSASPKRPVRKRGHGHA